MIPLQAVFLTYLASVSLRVFDTADLNIIASMRRSFYAAFTRLSFKVAAPELRTVDDRIIGTPRVVVKCCGLAGHDSLAGCQFRSFGCEKKLPAHLIGAVNFHEIEPRILLIRSSASAGELTIGRVSFGKL